MDNSIDDKLQTAYTLIKAGKSDQAREILLPLVRANPNLADGWFLLGHAVSDPKERIRCFQQVLRIEPDNDAAKKQLARLLLSTKAKNVSGKTARESTSKKRNPALLWGLAGLIGLVICLASFGFLWVNNKSLFIRPTQTISVKTDPILPTVTLTVFTSTPEISLTPRSTSRPTITLQPTSTPQPSVTILPTLTLTFTPTPSPAPRSGPKISTACVAPNGLGNFTAPFKVENFGSARSIVTINGNSQNGNNPINCQMTVKQGIPATIDLALGDYDYTVLRSGTVRNGTFSITQSTKATMRIFADKIQIGEFP